MRPSESLEAHPSKVTGRPSFVRDGVTLMRALGGRFDTTPTPREHTDDVKPPLSVTTSVAVKWPGLVYVQVTPVVGGSTVAGRWPLPHVNVCDAIVPAPTAYESLPSRVALNGGIGEHDVDHRLRRQSHDDRHPGLETHGHLVSGATTAPLGHHYSRRPAHWGSPPQPGCRHRQRRARSIDRAGRT